MSAVHQQPTESRSRSTQRAPQVVVRAGKTFLCSACGTLVQVPEDVVGQLVIAVERSTEDPYRREERASVEPSHDVPPQPRSTPAKTCPPRPGRPKRPAPDGRAAQIIDGLRVPLAGELDRALAWVSFHLKVLDRQGSEVKRLKKLLKQSMSCSRSRGHAKEPAARRSHGPVSHALERHAQADLDVSPGVDDAHQRGPP
ncbi:hypothetical protein Pan97_17050 [Bremerella volcania]|uniref:Uncharacterized protein n=1 Tax=Bremerella volcania TaxID=2527984 RepID=A0A518C652_9BACT|nr:hypothetical protein [Bremerella volcania]QDU74692.1 hypothetical protein Pan97_17050 [Bremerella volcania]